MRTEKPSSPASAAARLRTEGVRAWLSVLAQGPAVRWFGAAGLLSAVLAAAYVATLPATGRYLGDGRQYSADDIAKVTRALDAQRIGYGVVDRRIDVSSDRYNEAMALVQKLDLEPDSPFGIRQKKRNGGILGTLETSIEKERRELETREEILETMIRKLDGLVSAFVSIKRVQTREGVRPKASATAFVYLETEADRELAPKTVQAIQKIIVASEPDVKRDAVTVCDRKGRIYADAGNPEVGAISRTRARESELSDGILEKLDWLKGVHVTVHLVPAPAPPPTVVVEETRDPSEPKIGVNQPVPPLDLEPRPVVTAPPPAAPKPDAEEMLAHIWVQVPMSYYYLRAAPGRTPSAEDLQPYVGKTEALIRTAVEYVVPEDERGILKIDTIPDNVVSRSTLVAPAVPETWRGSSWWVAVGAGAGLAAIGLALAIRVLAARRPRVAVRPQRGRRRDAREDSPESGPGPSERVRELIRRDPEAAASVLNRWIGQGGHAA